MNYGALLPLASLMSTAMWIGLFVLAALTAGASLYFFTRARHREAVIPARDAETSRAVSEMRSLGDRIETIVSQQQLQGETQRAHLGQQIESVQQTVSQQGHRVDGLRAELHNEVQRRDEELQAIRQQLADIQTSSIALPPAAETLALPPAPQPSTTQPAAAPAAPAAPAPFAEEPSGDSFAGAEALPPPPPTAPSPVVEPPAVEPSAAPTPPHDPFADAVPARPAAPSTPSSTPPAAPPAAGSMFSDMGFDAFAPGEPAGDPFADLTPAPLAPEPAAPAPAPPAEATPASPAASDFSFADFGAPSAPAAAPSAPDGGAWVAAPRTEPAPDPSPAPDAVPVFGADDWDVPAAAPPATVMPPAESFAAPEPDPVPAFVPPPDADDFSFISTVTDDVQRALYMAGVTKLEEMAHWSRGDARRISSEVGVSEETIMNQWVFEAQGALFERYSSGVGS